MSTQYYCIVNFREGCLNLNVPIELRIWNEENFLSGKHLIET